MQHLRKLPTTGSILVMVGLLMLSGCKTGSPSASNTTPTMSGYIDVNGVMRR